MTAEMEADFVEKQLHNTFKFKCKQHCDMCCKFNDIALYPFDIMLLCRRLGLTTQQFHQEYSRFEFDHTDKILRCYLRTSPICKLYHKDAWGCTVYEDRPIRCRLFPVARMFFNTGTVKHYLPREGCPGFFETGQKQTIESWMKESNVTKSNEIIVQWNQFVNELKDSGLPLEHEFFIAMYAKMFFDFDNDLTKVVFSTTVKDDTDFTVETRMEKLYELANIYLYKIDDWMKGYEEMKQAGNFDNNDKIKKI